MKILESTLVPKSPAKKSEDGLVVTPDFIAVIDGSTSKTTHRHSRFASNGRYAMQLVSRYIRRMPADTSCHQFCKGVTAYVFRRYQLPLLPSLTPQSRIRRLREHPEERLCASAVVYSRLRREIWLVGDCQCLVSGQFYDNPKPYEQQLADMRAQRVRQLLDAGTPPADLLQSRDPAREVMLPTMVKTMKNQNVTYAVIDGFPIPEAKVPILTLDFRPWEIVLASDGYPFLCPTLAESEQRLARQREEDPLNIGTFTATKAFVSGNNSFDDRTYIRFQV